MFKVIEGGASNVVAIMPKAVRAADVYREAERRLREAGYEQARIRAIATGGEIPVELRRLRLMTTYAASKIASLETIPQDYRDDGYWPKPG